MKTKKWHKFHASKAQFPSYQVDGAGKGKSKRKGMMVVGHKAALAALEQSLERSLNDAVIESTRYEWIFKFPVDKVPARRK